MKNLLSFINEAENAKFCKLLAISFKSYLQLIIRIKGYLKFHLIEYPLNRFKRRRRNSKDNNAVYGFKHVSHNSGRSEGQFLTVFV